MPIYAEKRNGKLTGQFRVEVTWEGQRLRPRFNSLAEAQAAEPMLLAQLKGEVVGTKAPTDRVDHRRKGQLTSLSAAIDAAEGRVWKGLPSETDNMTKLRCFLGVVGDKPLDEISLADADKFVADLEARGRSGATVNRHLSALNKFLKWTHAREYRVKPLFKLEWEKESEGRIRWIEPEEEARLMELLPSDTAKLVKAAIVTGMRRGELLALTPEQIEWHVADGCGWVRLWDTKNGKPRSVPISRDTYEDLRYLAGEGLNHSRMPAESSLAADWNKARRKMGLAKDPWFVFHCCRHTCATRLVQANVNLAVVKEFMGHKTIETTLRYAHVNATSLTEALRTLVAHRGGRLRKVA